MPRLLTSRLAALALLAVASFSLGRVGLLGERHNFDEGHWITRGSIEWPKFLSGQWDDPCWFEYDRLWGWGSPPVAKFFFGVSLQLHGLAYENREDAIPPAEVLIAGRLASVVVASLGVLGFFGLAARVFPVRFAVVASLLLASSPVWLVQARRAMVDIHGVALAVLGVLLFTIARCRIPSGEVGRTVLAFAGAGVLLGMAVGSKITAAGMAVGCGTLLLLDLGGEGLRLRVPGAGRRVTATVLGGLVLAAAALAIFVGTYPYLHDDPVKGVRTIITTWNRVTSLHVENPQSFYAEAYPPGIRSFTELVGNVLVPATRVGWALLLPLAGALATHLPGARKLGADTRDLLLWTLALPALLAGLVQPGEIIHVWIVWAGLVVGAARFLAVGGIRGLPRNTRSAIVPIAVASLVAFVFIVRMSNRTWARYYLLLLPFCGLVAAWGLHGLHRAVSARAGTWGGRLVILAALLGVVGVLPAFPEYGGARLARVADSSWVSPIRLLTTASALSLVAVVLFAWFRTRRAGQLSSSATEAASKTSGVIPGAG